MSDLLSEEIATAIVDAGKGAGVKIGVVAFGTAVIQKLRTILPRCESVAEIERFDELGQFINEEVVRAVNGK